MPIFMEVMMIGKKFGRYTVLERAENTRRGAKRYLVLCECGERRIVQGGTLRIGRATSCGCWGKGDAHRTHGLCKRNGKRMAEHIAWRTIHRNCTNSRAA